MKKILVTGGTVFVSQYIAEWYVKKGFEVFVLNRGTRPQAKGVHLIKADRHMLSGELKGLSFDLVIDTGYTAEDVGTLLDALDSYKDYVFISSSAVYPEYETQPFREDCRLAENKFWGAYGLNKLSAESLLLERAPNAYILRPPYLYGVGNNLYREAFAFDCAIADRKFCLPQDGAMKLQFLCVEDLCRIIDKLPETRPERHIFNVGNEKSVSIKEWVTLCYEAAGKRAEFAEIWEDIDQRNYFSFRSYEYSLDISEQRKFLPINSKPLKDGLKESYNWYKNNADKVLRKGYMEFIDRNFKDINASLSPGAQL